MLEAFGPERIRDTPISETALIGAAVGAAQDGMRPVVEQMFVDFFGVCFDSIYNLMAKNIYFAGGNLKVPMVLMTSTAGGYSDAGQHSQCLYGTFAHLPGMKVVAPSNAYDAKGLMTAALCDESPVVCMYQKGLQGMGWLGTEAGATVHVPEESYTVEIGKAEVVREGRDVTIVGIGMGAHNALKAAKKLDENGVSAEIADLVSLVPLDRDTIRASVAKTGRLIVVDEAYQSYGISGEIIAKVTEYDISVLKAAPKRVAFPDPPIPYTRVMEQFLSPEPGEDRRRLGRDGRDTARPNLLRHLQPFPGTRHGPCPRTRKGASTRQQTSPSPQTFGKRTKNASLPAGSSMTVPRSTKAPWWPRS